MGRAYIVKEYNKKPMPLFLIMDGIVHYHASFPVTKSV